MMQGSNENTKEIIGIISILDYLELIQICITQHNCSSLGSLIFATDAELHKNVT